MNRQGAVWLEKWSRKWWKGISWSLERDILSGLYDTLVLQETSKKEWLLWRGMAVFATRAAKAAGHRLYVSSDIKYHEFFVMLKGVDARRCRPLRERTVHKQTFCLRVLRENFPTFALLKSGVQTNPVHHLHSLPYSGMRYKSVQANDVRNWDDAGKTNQKSYGFSKRIFRREEN